MAARLDAQLEALARGCRKHGLATPTELLSGPCKYRWDLIERDINKLLGRDRGLPADSPTGIREEFIDRIACHYLSCCRVEQVPVPENLLHLISEQLGVWSYAARRPNKAEALKQAQDICATNPDISDSELARRVGVSTKTIRNWRRAGLLPDVGLTTK